MSKEHLKFSSQWIWLWHTKFAKLQQFERTSLCLRSACDVIRSGCLPMVVISASEQTALCFWYVCVSVCNANAKSAAAAESGEATRAARAPKPGLVPFIPEFALEAPAAHAATPSCVLPGAQLTLGLDRRRERKSSLRWGAHTARDGGGAAHDVLQCQTQLLFSSFALTLIPLRQKGEWLLKHTENTYVYIYANCDLHGRGSLGRTLQRNFLLCSKELQNFIKFAFSLLLDKKTFGFPGGRVIKIFLIFVQSCLI